MPKKGHSKAVYLLPSIQEEFKEFCKNRTPKTTMFVLLNQIVVAHMDKEKGNEK